MLINDLKNALRFYFITDDSAPDMSAVDQVKTAILAGATMIQYRNKTFSPGFYDEVIAIRDICKSNHVPLIINDHILLAKAVSADGVHVGQEDENPAIARNILGPVAIVGFSVSNLAELEKTDLSPCDYIGVGPVYQTGTKPDAKSIIGLSGLKSLADASSLPVVAIGGIDDANGAACFENGADGISLISAISRSAEPLKSALALSRICGCSPREKLVKPWNDEFGLIAKLMIKNLKPSSKISQLIVPPGDDTCLLSSISRPVITTDTHREGVHFSFTWQTPEEVGQKAVEITLSDLAAAYAQPICIFINLGLPPYMPESTVLSLYDGIYTALNRHQCELGGGNIAGADQLSLDIFAVGQAGNDIFPTRSKAKPGHKLYTTGPLGSARTGLAALMKKDLFHTRLIEKFKHPRARFDAAKILADHGIECVMDISDGLYGDATHIAEASHISIRLTIEEKFIENDMVDFCRQYKVSAIETAMAGGEDYELLFTCLPDVFEKIHKALPESFQVGECLPYNDKLILSPKPKGASFQHGAR